MTIDFITHSTQFQTGIFGGLFQIVQTMAQLTGGMDVKTGAQLLTANQSVLQGGIGGLLNSLSSGYGINLQGLANNPTGLIQALSGLNYSQLEAGMTSAQQSQFEGLINSIISNVGALESNTVQLQQLNGQLQQPQSWSTNAWQTFRTAFFTGMGGLLPSYASIPHMQGGGEIAREGLAYLHSAEVVTPKGEMGGDTHVHMHMTNPTEVFDPVHAAHRTAWAWKTSARR